MNNCTNNVHTCDAVGLSLRKNRNGISIASWFDEGRDMSEMDLKKQGANGQALLIIDMITDFKFEDGSKLFEPALHAAKNIAGLKRRAKQTGTDVIYVNDNYGRWNEDFRTFVDHTANSSAMGREIVDTLEPEAGDLFVVKPQRSGFYATPLGVLLMSKNVSRVVVAGVTTDICVLFTAHDAFMRGFGVRVPSDGTAAVKPEHHDMALDFMARVAEADIRTADEIDLENHASAVEKKPSRRTGFMDSFSGGKMVFAGT